MKKKIAAIVSSALAIFGLVLVIYTLVVKPKTEIIDFEELLTLFILTIWCISTLLYIRWTSFGNTYQSEIKKIETENQLLKKKIEQKELKAKLEGVSQGNA